MKRDKWFWILLMVSSMAFSYPAYGAEGDYSQNCKEIKEKYSEEELCIIQEIAKEIETENEEATAIDVEKIVSSTIDFKFDTPPIILEDRTLVPVRAITESLGASVTWYPSSQKVLIEKDTKKMVLYINNNSVVVDGKEKSIDVPAKIFSSRTYVPLRFVVEEYGLEIEYDSETGIITINE